MRATFRREWTCVPRSSLQKALRGLALCAVVLIAMFVDVLFATSVACC